MDAMDAKEMLYRQALERLTRSAMEFGLAFIDAARAASLVADDSLDNYAAETIAKCREIFVRVSREAPGIAQLFEKEGA